MAFADTSPPRFLPLDRGQMVVSGALDPIVPSSFGEAYGAAAMKSGDPVQVLTIQGAGHFELIAPMSAAWRQLFPLSTPLASLEVGRERRTASPQDTEPQAWRCGHPPAGARALGALASLLDPPARHGPRSLRLRRPRCSAGSASPADRDLILRPTRLRTRMSGARAAMPGLARSAISPWIRRPIAFGPARSRPTFDRGARASED